MYAMSCPALMVMLAGAFPAPAPNDPPAEIVGVISIDDKPLPAGRVFIHTGGGQFVGARVKDGKYKVSGVPAGKHTVTVEAEGLPARYTSENLSPLVAVVGGKGKGEGMSYDYRLQSK